MKQKRKVRVYQNLGTVAKAQRLLWKCEQEKSYFKRLYVEALMERCKVERELKIEMQRNGFYCDCAEFLQIELHRVKLNQERAEEVLKKYAEFRQRAYKEYCKKKEALNKIEVSIFGEYKTLYASDKSDKKHEVVL